MLLFGLAIQGQFLVMVLFFQNARGFDQLHAAYAILPAPIASFIISIIGGRFSRRINSFYLAITGMVAIAVGFFLACFTTPATPYLVLAGENVILGLGIGLIFQALPNLSMSEVPPPKLGVASGVFNTFRQIGYSLGIAILLSMLTGQTQSNLPTALTHSVQLVKQCSLPAQTK
jgi:MFS family permease